MKRVFLAIPVNYEIVGAIRSFISLNTPQLDKKSLKKFRWIREENLHVTILFIGEVEEKLIPQIIDRVFEVILEKKSFELEFDDFRSAADPKYPRMIWAAFKQSPEFTKLHNQMIEAVQPIARVDASRKDPVPHITVARYNPVRNPEWLLKQPFQKKNQVVRSFELWQSNFSKEGVSYESLASFDLD